MKLMGSSVMVMIAATLIGVTAGEAQSKKISEQGQACVDCHKELSPSFVKEWDISTHAKNGIDCFSCHKAEKSDPDAAPPVDLQHMEDLSRLEDYDVTNQYSAMGSLKPGLLRLLTLIGVLKIINYAARHLVRPGRLARIRTIHFARWVLIGGAERMAFFSNYDGSDEAYMDDFINKAGYGLNVFTSNGVLYPRTNWLVLDGAADELKFKNFQRRHTLPTEVWYKAYPGLTAIDLERNTRICRGLKSSSMSDQEACEWVALL